MRELHVAGYDANENKIILRDSTNDDEFSIVADEQLRAAARGDVPGMCQVTVEKSNTMRPSEIQELIRAGASTDELADKAGMQRSRLENLARPILMERANMVRRAQESHPVLADGPSDITLAMAIHTALSARGIDYHDGSWDSWKTADGHWIIELRWEERHADNTAHWRFQQDRSYAVTSPIDETASELTDPDFSPHRLSTVAPISNLGVARLRNSQTSQEDRQKLAVAAQRDAAGIPDSSRPESVQKRTPGYVKSVTIDMEDFTTPTTPQPVRSFDGSADTDTSDSIMSERTTPADAPTEQLTLDNIRQFSERKNESATHSENRSEKQPPIKPLPLSRAATRKDTAKKDDDSHHSSHKKQKHPTMPSWEDVLLGVRGQQNDN